MKPEEVPDELLDLASKATYAAWDKLTQTQKIEDPQRAVIRLLLTDVLPAHEAMIRTKISEQIEQELLTSAWDPGGMARAARIARGVRARARGDR